MSTPGVKNGQGQRPLRRSKRSEKTQGLAVESPEETRQDSQQLPQASLRKRKRAQEVEGPDPNRADERRKRIRVRVGAGAARVEKDSDLIAPSSTSEESQNPIEYWSQYGRWPRGHFEQSSNVDNILARKRSRASLSLKSSEGGALEPSTPTPSDQKQRETKSAPYRDARYEILLASKGSFMKEANVDITDKSKSDVQELLAGEPGVPQDSLFGDGVFKMTCQRIRNRNESKVIQDIARLIVPSAETLATYGATNLECLIESVNEGWNDSIPVTKTRPQPDYAVGFPREAFTEDQLKRLGPFVGEVTDSRNESYFMATFYLYFPFLTCEVKCGAAALDIADRQNAHSMTIAVRAVVELFRYVGRQKELDREILAFSISHDHRSVRIYGHYAVVDGKKQTYYRHPIREFNFNDMNGREKWTTYKFVKNVYEIWMPEHFKRICSAIDAFPSEVSFDLSQQSALHFTEPSGLSQDFDAHSLAQSSVGSGPALAQADGHSSAAEAADMTPNTSMHELNEGRRLKRPKKDGK